MTPISRLLIWCVAIAGLALAWIAHAAAQPSAPTPPAPKPEMTKACPGLVASAPALIAPAAFRHAALAADQVRITYVGHSTFLIESPRLVRIATDYNDYVRPPLVPDIATMNHAHSTHYSLNPDPGIKLVLRGWRDDGKPAAPRSHLRRRAGAQRRHQYPRLGRRRHRAPRQFDLHLRDRRAVHRPSRPPASHADAAAARRDRPRRCRAGRRSTAATRSMSTACSRSLQALKAPLMIPMHYFSAFTLDRFLDRVRSDYEVEYADTPSLVLSKATLPAKPKFLVLPGH